MLLDLFNFIDDERLKGGVSSPGRFRPLLGTAKPRLFLKILFLAALVFFDVALVTCFGTLQSVITRRYCLKTFVCQLPSTCSRLHPDSLNFPLFFDKYLVSW